MKDKRFRKGLITSVIAHCSLVAFLMIQSSGSDQSDRGVSESEQQGKEGRGSKKEVQVDIIDPPAKDKGAEDSDPNGLLQSAPHASDKCEQFYGGIGINQVNTVKVSGEEAKLQVIVESVHPGYPAEKAGIKAGDVLLNSDGIRGDIGTPVTVLTLRDGTPRSYNLTRDKICTSPRTEGP